MKKRALSVLCVIALCLTLLPSAALAADEADEWTYVGEGGYIQSADGQIRLEISINETDKAITITKAAAVPENCVLVLPKSVAIGGDAYTITAVGSSAFYRCKSLISLDFSKCKDLTTIGENAFHDCKSLIAVDLSGCAKLKTIGARAFSVCEKLSTLDLFGCTGLETIGEYAFSACEDLASVDLSYCGNLTTIGDSAFVSSGLTSVDLSDCKNLKTIGTSAFMTCRDLALADLSGCAGLESIGEGAFYSCANLETVLLPDGQYRIAGNAFFFCRQLKSMTVFAHEPPSITSTSLSFFSDDATIYVPDKYKDRYTYLWGSGHYKISGQSLFLAPASPSWTGHYGSDNAGKTIVITNGTGSTAFGVNVSITNANDFERDFGEFPSELSADSYTTFTIKPNAGLPEGTYNSQVTVKATVNGTEVTETINLSFTVKRALTSAEITLSGSNVTVTLDGKTLTEGQDYALNYSNNGETTTVIVTGTGVYTGVVTESFDADLLPGVGLGPGTGLVPGSDNIPVVLPGANAVNVAPSEHGSVSVTPGNSSVGGLVTVTVAPDEGCSLAGLTVTDASGSEIAVSGSGGTYTFTMPDSAVTVTATFRAGAAACDHGASCPLRAFNDLDAYAWYHDGIHYCLANGLMDGTGAAAFEPNANMTRAMVWAILARIDGETVTGANWAETARAWAISTGVSDGADPDANVTREQLATMLWRFAGSETATGSLTRYPDYAEISSWADQAMLWATVLGVIEGNESGNIAPTAAATRAQAATMLMRFCGSVE